MTHAFDPAVLRVVFVTDGRGDEARIEAQVQAVVRGGVRTVQVREPLLKARQLAELGERLRQVLASCDGMLLVNDRVDCAAAGAFDGAQVGHHSLRPLAARRALGHDRVLGVSTHDAAELAEAVAAGADFALLSPIWPVRAKPQSVPLGVATAAALTAVASLPVVWLGGIEATGADEIAALPQKQRPVGVAVMSLFAQARDPQAAAAGVVAAFAAVLRR